jgi:hypothetical protein
MKQHEITRRKMNYRHKEKGWEVVSTVLCDRWDNAVHPKNHDEFNNGTIADTDLPRYTPKNDAEWETFFTEETHMPHIVDKDAYRQFESSFHEDTDFLNAKKTAEFLHDTFTATYYFDGDFAGTGRYDDCRTCDGTGRLSDDEYSHSPFNEPRHLHECSDCDGTGEHFKESFSRTFPYERNKILSEMPTTKELQVVQFTLNKMSKTADERDGAVSSRKVLALFNTLENHDAEALISHAVNAIKPGLDTIEVEREDEEGNTVVEEQPDPEAVEETKTKLTSTLGVSMSNGTQKQPA